MVPPGLIPACAGKTVVLGHSSHARRAHPRVCGENSNGGNEAAVELGSSPRVRGKHIRSQRGNASHRLIPACAGKTNQVLIERSHAGAHPRVCGENSWRLVTSCVIDGSSPRVRGKRTRSPGPCSTRRLIPACAGKTDGFARSIPDEGLIPACAGKTLFCTVAHSTGWAHPRVCGENILVTIRLLSKRGSSPRVRGKHRRCCADYEDVRLIPACAGKTWAVFPKSSK